MKIRKTLYVLLFLFVLSACAGAEVKTDVIPAGQKAADFTLPDQNGKTWTLGETLKDYKAVILAFYPKDDTGLWIKEFVEFQQNIAQYEARKVKILGLSRDSAESHLKFIAKHGLNNMTLLVDEKGKIAKMYDADHWILPLSKRVYMIVDQKMNVIYRKDMGFALLPDQTQTLIRVIDHRKENSVEK